VVLFVQGFLSFASFVLLCTKAVASRVGRPCFFAEVCDGWLGFIAHGIAGPGYFLF
jgi:hypothetical protein